MPNGTPITITVTSETAQAAAQMQAFFAQMKVGMAQFAGSTSNAGNAAGHANHALKEMRESSLLLRESFHSLNAATVLLGGEKMRELGEGMMLLRSGMGAIRTSSILTGASLSTILPIGAAVAALVAGGVILWGNYSTAEELAAARAKSLAETLAKLPPLLNLIRTAQTAGAISPEQALKYADYLSGRKKLYVPPGGAGHLVETPTLQTGTTGNFDFRTGQGTVTQGKDIKLKEASQAQVQAWVEQQLVEQKGEQVRLEGAEKYRELQKQIQNEALVGVEKERAEANKKYDDLKLKAKQYYDEAGAGEIQATEQADTNFVIEQKRKEALAEIDRKAGEEAQKRFDEFSRKQLEADREHVKSVMDEFRAKAEMERQQNPTKRTKNSDASLFSVFGRPDHSASDAAYKKEIDQINQLYLESTMGEKEYTKLVAQAGAQRIQSRAQEVAAQLRLDREREEGAKTMLGNMATIAGAFGREGFEASKAFASAQAAIDGYRAAVGAFAWGSELGGPALGAVAAAISIAATGVQIAQIESQQYQGRRRGGSVTEGVPYIVGEDRPEVFVPNESGFILPNVPQSISRTGATPGQAGKVIVQNHIWGDMEAEMHRHIQNSPRIQHAIVNLNNKHRRD